MLLTIFLLALTILQSNNQTHLIRRDVLNCKKKDQTIVLQDLIWNPQKLIGCNEVQNVGGVEITWNISIPNSKYLAIPHCLGDDGVYQYRLCKNGNFITKVNCANIQLENYCPKSMDNFKGKCLLLLNRIKSEDAFCPYHYSINFGIYKHLFLNENIWAPIKRNLDYGYGEMLIEEFSSDYGEPFNQSMDYDENNLLLSNCAVYANSKYEVVPCDSLNDKVCIYEQSHNFQPNFCTLNGKNCFNADYNTTNSDCYCLSTEFCNFAELKEFYQEGILRKKCQNGCKLDLVYERDKLLWATSKRFPAYTGWGYSESEIFIKDGQVVQDKLGWRIAIQKLKYQNICAEKYMYTKPTIDFTYNDDTLKIHVKNGKHFAKTEKGIYLFCFTDSSPDHLRKQIYKLTDPNDTGEIPIEESGFYWCEGFAVHNFEKIVSKKYLAMVEEVYPIEITFNIAKEDPTTSAVAYDTHIKKLEDFINNNYSRSIIVKLKWAKTLSIDFHSRTVTYLVHVCGPNRIASLSSLLEIEELLINTIPKSIVLGRLRSFYFCVNSDTTFNNVTYKWPTTYVTSYASSDIPCLSTNREIVKRLCKEDNINGASFEKIENCLTSPSSNYTEKLNDLLNSNISITDIVSKLITVTENAESFKPIDLFLVSSIIDKFVYESTNLSSITTVISNVINTRTEISEESQRNYNATDQILYSFDLILEREGKPYEDLEIKESNLFVKIFTGLHGFIFKDNNEIIEIEEDMDFMSFAKIPQLSAAIYIPNVKARATVSLFLKDTLFNENKRRNIANNFGVILSDNIEQIYLIFKPADGLGTYRHSCGFWNYGFAKRGNWKLESRPKYLGVLQICEYSHVTHFGLLVIDEDFIEDSDILSVISSIEIGLSLFGILGIFLTGAVFKTWRENIGNKILIHYGIVSLVQIVLLYVSEKVLGAESWICILTGVLLHYTVLSQFCWMLVIGLLQYKRYIQVFVGNSRWVLIKACFVSYGIPAFPVMILFGFFSDTYVDGRVGLCYPTGNGLIYGVLLPIGIIVTVNILIFSRIIFELFCKPKINSSVEDEVLILRLRLVLLMFFMLGITWVFGFAAQIFESDFLIYLFLITSSIQGFMIFVFFIVFNKNARKMYVYLWNKYSCR